MKPAIRKYVFLTFWCAGLGAITLVLLREWKTGGGWDYYSKLGVVGLLWGIFILSFPAMKSFAELKVLTARLDRLIISLILIVTWLLVLTSFIGALIGLHIIPALLFGLFGWGLFNVIRDFAFAPIGKHRKV
ncbi:MAG: hypothetical protein HY706_14230 [Candidatus Hydrogenedentes bacterium]|nr:hypothetical protein [Candidatus Hydrogenedentota bacterium]